MNHNRTFASYVLPECTNVRLILRSLLLLLPNPVRRSLVVVLMLFHFLPLPMNTVMVIAADPMVTPVMIRLRRSHTNRVSYRRYRPSCGAGFCITLDTRICRGLMEIRGRSLTWLERLRGRGAYHSFNGRTGVVLGGGYCKFRDTR